MRVAVGSGNPVKEAATREVLADRAERVVAVGVDSGVSEQPFGIGETVTGARNRASRALRAGKYDLGIGIEGGVADVEWSEGLFLVNAAAATDGDRVETGIGPGLRLPDRIARRVADGEELGPVMDDVTGDHGVKRGPGAAGVLTDGVTDRERALGQAIATATGPFFSEHYG